MTNANNQSLAANFSDLAKVATDAIEWNRKASTGSHRLQLDVTDNLEFFLETRLAARKLNGSAQRPPCAGVFGPSQAGKSYLVSALARPENGPFTVQFAGQEVDFLQRINPGGGRESTGVVTRFSLHPPGYNDNEFPVEIRLLSEPDILKILFNSFFSDLDHTGSLRLEKLSFEAITARLDAMRGQASAKEVAGSIAPEDVLDIRHYLEQSYKSLIESLGTQFWPALMDLVPRLSLAQRASLFSIIWRDCTLFTDLYVQLAQSIASLGHASECLIPLSALVSSPNSPGIVDAQLLGQIGQAGSPAVTVRPIWANAVQGGVEITKPLLAALTAELRLTVKQARWDFLKSSDILDFPGARSRLRLTDVQSGTHEGKSLAAELLLRGKVAYLFHRYTVDHELSSVILCVPWGPQEVTGYAPLIEQWVKENQGKDPEERGRKPPGLLLVLTKFDMDLQAKGGDTESTERLRWPDRIKSSLLERFGGMDWVGSWDGKPFRNTFWLRNPEIKDSPYMRYEQGVEVAINPDQEERLIRLRQYFTEDELVGKHFDQAGPRWDAAMTPRDGGIRLIVDSIHQSSDPQLHWEGLKRKYLSLNDSLGTYLRKYFNDSQDEELAKKTAIFNAIKNDLKRLVVARNIWQIFDLLIPNTAELRNLYFDVAKEDKAMAPASQEKAEENFDLDAFFASEVASAGATHEQATPQHASHNRAVAFAERCTEFWISRMRSLARQDTTQSLLSASEKSIQAMIEELALATQRLALSGTMARALHPAESNAGVTWELIADRQVNIARNVMGEFLGQLGMSDWPLIKRPGQPPEQPQRRVFQPYTMVDGQNLPLSEQPINVSSVVALDWLIALQRMIIDNVGFSGQDSLSPELNAELGALVGKIEGGQKATAALQY